MVFVTNCSLPRAGSQLLQTFLEQHPEIYASPTSPLLEYWFGAAKNTNLSEVKSQNPVIMGRSFKEFLRLGTLGYYNSITNKRVVVDKSRAWVEYDNLLNEIFPNTPILCIVRPLSEIITSFEKIYRNNQMHPECAHLPKTTFERAVYWLKELPLGLSLKRLSDFVENRPHKNLIMIRYRDLCQNPVETMDLVFKNIGVDPFTVDPNNLIKKVEEDDSHFGIFGSHKVAKVLRTSIPDPAEILGGDLVKKIDDSAPDWLKNFLNS